MVIAPGADQHRNCTYTCSEFRTRSSIKVCSIVTDDAVLFTVHSVSVVVL